MGAPKLIPGGPTLAPASSGSVEADKIYGKSTGDFGKHPGATVKYAINDGHQRDAEYRETLARMFIQMPAQERSKFVKSCPAETRDLAKILCGAGSGAAGGTGFIDFLLQSANESFNEKYQVVESLSDNFIIYVFGQRATPFQYSGMLKNTYQDDQRVWMMRLYRDILRGTQLARRRKLVRLRYDSVIVSGVMLGLNMQIQGDLKDGVPFSFVLMPTQYVIFTPTKGVPTQLSTAFTEGSEFGLATTAVPKTGKVRVVAPPRGQVSTSKKRKNAKGDNPYKDSKKTVKKKATTNLTSRLKITSKVPKTNKSVRGGITPTEYFDATLPQSKVP